MRAALSEPSLAAQRSHCFAARRSLVWLSAVALRAAVVAASARAQRVRLLLLPALALAPAAA
jgi:hypothetical protein